MQVTKTAIPDVLIIEPKVFGDARGFFFESFNQQAFDAAVGKHYDFVQDNHSKSSRGVLRGLHYQVEQTQGKLVRVVQGSVLDVAVDIRKSSATFGQWVAVELNADNHRQLWVPPGFAHGFVVYSETAEFCTKPPISMPRRMSAVLPGMIRRLPSTGIWATSRHSCRAKTSKAKHWQMPMFLPDSHRSSQMSPIPAHYTCNTVAGGVCTL